MYNGENLEFNIVQTGHRRRSYTVDSEKLYWKLLNFFFSVQIMTRVSNK